MRRALLALLVSAPLAAQVCDPPAKVREAIDGAAVQEQAPIEERLARAGTVRAAFPADYFANLFYLDAAGLPAPAEVQSQYRQLRDARPGDVAYRTLYARALIGSQTSQAIPSLEQAGAAFPPALVQLARIHSSVTFHDDAKLRADAAAYEKACPESLAMYPYLWRIEDAAFARDRAASLRRIVAGRSDNEALALYRTLWRLEFQTVPLAGQEPVRTRVRSDAVRLRAMGAARPDAMKSLMTAYRLLDDTEGQQWVAEHAPAAVPQATGEAQRAINRWEQANDPDGQASSPDYWKKLLARSDAWIRQWPLEPQTRRERFEALAHIEGSAPEDIAKAGDEWLRVYNLHGELFGISPYLEIARAYAEKGMRTAELPALIEKGIADMRRTADAPESDLDLHDAAMDMSHHLLKWNTLGMAADLDIQLRRHDQAHDVLLEFGKSLEGQPAGVVEYRYWALMVRLARAENRTLDALAYERNAIAANLRDAAVAATYANAEARIERLAKVGAERTEEARALWKSLGGGDQAFAVWLALPPDSEPVPVPPARPASLTAAEPWKPIGRALPEFALADAQGKTWHLADLQGKVTLVNLWATWCEPCRNELPYVQKLYESVRGRSDLAVVTFDMDENPGLIEPFLKENHYTFPALPAYQYVRKMGQAGGIPQNWIVSAAGVIEQGRLGAGKPDERWVADMIARMERARKPR